MANLRSAFGANLKLIRKLKSITQEKLAEMLDIHPRQLAKIEAGEHFPSSKTLEKICFVFDMQPAELFNFEIDLECEYLKTGTDDVCYKVDLKDGQVKADEDTSTGEIDFLNPTDFDARVQEMSKKLGHEVIVKFHEDSELQKIVSYRPDKVSIVKEKPDKMQQKNIMEMLEKIKKIAGNERNFKFIELAIDSIGNKKSLEKLGLMVDGMRMSQGNI